MSLTYMGTFSAEKTTQVFVGKRLTPILRSKFGLVVSPAEFNEASGLPVILPITNGGEFARRWGFAVPITGIKTTGVVRCDQPRMIDLAARHARKVDTLPAPIMDEVLAKVTTLFE